MCNPNIKLVGITNQKSQRRPFGQPDVEKVATFIFFLCSLDTDDDQELEMNEDAIDNSTPTSSY